MKDLLHLEYAVGFPDGWTDRTELIMVGPEREGRYPAVTLKRIMLEVDMSLEQFVGFQVQALEVLMGVKQPDVIEQKETTLSGVPAHTRLYRMKFLDKLCVQRQIYAIRGRTAYVITATSASDHYVDDAPIFDEIIRRFRFLAAGG